MAQFSIKDFLINGSISLYYIHTLIRKGSIYFFSEDADDYLVLKDSAYGLSYSEGYFKNYSGCANGDQIDVSWSYTAVNGVMAQYGIGETPLEGLNEYGFVINGWATGE